MNTIQNYGLNYNVNMKGHLSKIAEMKEISEVTYDKLIGAMPKTKKGLIDKRFLDKKDKEVLNNIPSFRKNVEASVDIIKNYFKAMITNEKQEIYNGHKATVRRNLLGHIRAVKTGAHTEKEAVKELGLKQCGIKVKDKNGNWSYYYNNFEDYTGIPLYEAKYSELINEQQGIKEDYFTWNSMKKEMELFNGLWTPV